MTPFFKANPALAYHKNNDNESPQDILNAGKQRAAQAAEELKEAEDQREEAIAAREKKAKEESELKMKELEFAEKLQNANDEDNNEEDILFQQAEWLKEEIKGKAPFSPRQPVYKKQDFFLSSKSRQVSLDRLFARVFFWTERQNRV